MSTFTSKSAAALMLVCAVSCASAETQEVSLPELGVSFFLPADWHYEKMTDKVDAGDEMIFVGPAADKEPPDYGMGCGIVRFGLRQAGHDQAAQKARQMVAYYQFRYANRDNYEVAIKQEARLAELIDYGQIRKEDGFTYYWGVHSYQARNGLRPIKKEYFSPRAHYAWWYYCVAIPQQRSTDPQKAFEAASPNFERIFSSIRLLP